jgi:predicted amidohydrolase YtcJ
VRLDRWLRDRISPEPPDLAGVGRWLAARGVTALTDAGASNGPDELALLARAGLDQRLAAMTREVDVAAVSGVALGPVKVLLDDTDLPPLDELAGRIDAAHRHGRAVAVHCVTEVQAVLALSAGIGHRDRVEHGSLVSDGLMPVLAAADPAVIVQPGLVHTRGDRYLAEVDRRDRPGLHRLRSFQAAGLRVAASSDAPYGPADPWISIAAAADRTTREGRPLGPHEALAPADALRLFTGHLESPAGHRRLVDGEDADLVVLDDDWDRLARRPRLAATLIAGRVVAGRLPT